MIYVSSDLHGFPRERFCAMLDKVGFSDRDRLILLGDLIDRNGNGGIEMLKWCMMQENVDVLLGNHEGMLLACSFIFEELTEELYSSLDGDTLGRLQNWIYNGATPTINALKKEPNWLRREILHYIGRMPLYMTVEAGGRKFVLVHAGLGNFAPDKALDSYDANDLIWERPAMDTRYYDDRMVIFGHTPVQFYGVDPDRALHTGTWINIDTGAAGGLSPMLLRLDDMQEFYFDKMHI